MVFSTSYLSGAGGLCENGLSPKTKFGYTENGPDYNRSRVHGVEGAEPVEVVAINYKEPFEKKRLVDVPRGGFLGKLGFSKMVEVEDKQEEGHYFRYKLDVPSLHSAKSEEVAALGNFAGQNIDLEIRLTAEEAKTFTIQLKMASLLVMYAHTTSLYQILSRSCCMFQIVTIRASESGWTKVVAEMGQLDS